MNNRDALFDPIGEKVFKIRGQLVMLDRDLAGLYGVETGRLNESVKRNIDRFDDDFMFQLNTKEFENWKSQFAISNSLKKGLRHSPYAFTELGIAMLSSVLNSDIAIRVNKQIMRYFVHMRKIEIDNEDFRKYIESKLKLHDIKFEVIFSLLDDYKSRKLIAAGKPGKYGFKPTKDIKTSFFAKKVK